MDSQGDKIRVMIVYGAKGLEAPIVILFETMMRKKDFKGEILFVPDCVIWKIISAVMPVLIVMLRDAVLVK